MKRIILSLVMVTAVASLAVAATRAYFTSQASVLGNSVTSGNLKVSMGSSSAPFDVDALAPGDEWKDAGTFTVLNDGDMDMLFRLYVNPTLNQSNIADYIKVRVTIRPNEDEISGFELYGPEGGHEVFNGLLKNLLGESNALDNVRAAYLSGANGEPLWKKFAAVYKVEVGMDWEAPNTVQGKEFKGNLIVDAVQSENQPIKISDDVNKTITGVQW